MTLHHSSYKEPPRLLGGLPLIGHAIEFGKNPHAFMMQLRECYGEVAEFRLFHQPMVLLTGIEASEAFYRASDEVLDQGAAYKIMTPIFGKGVVFDAPLERKNQQLQMLMPALRDKPMRTYSEIIVNEVEQAIRHWGDSGTLNLLDFTKELTIYTSSHCLLGPEFRYELSGEFADIYSALEAGIQPIAYIFPYLPLPVFRRRDRARVRLQKLVSAIIEKRTLQKDSTRTNVFQTLIDARYQDGSALTPHEITGMLIATLFAGHHTSSGTTAWVLIELLRHPALLKAVLDELDGLFGNGNAITFEALRQMPLLERVIKEVLRLHPPLIFLLRKVMKDFQVKEYLVKAGKFVCAAPSVTHRIPEIFPNPEYFDPDRYLPDRMEDQSHYGWQAFGGGRHKCSGNAFALFQIKAIFSVLLRHYTFECVNDPVSYCDDYTKMVVEPRSPCLIRYKKRVVENDVLSVHPVSSHYGASSHRDTFQVTVDKDLCKGHAYCMAECPEVFQVDDQGNLTVLNETPPHSIVQKAKAAEKYCPTQAVKISE